jgi:hypothetical protein
MIRSASLNSLARDCKAQRAGQLFGQMTAASLAMRQPALSAAQI